MILNPGNYLSVLTTEEIGRNGRIEIVFVVMDNPEGFNCSFDKS
jgi:hypothetical protein